MASDTTKNLFERAKALIAEGRFDEVTSEHLYNSCESADDAADLGELIEAYLRRSKN